LKKISGLCALAYVFARLWDSNPNISRAENEVIPLDHIDPPQLTLIAEYHGSNTRRYVLVLRGAALAIQRLTRKVGNGSGPQKGVSS